MTAFLRGARASSWAASSHPNWSITSTAAPMLAFGEVAPGHLDQRNKTHGEPQRGYCAAGAGASVSSWAQRAGWRCKARYPVCAQVLLMSR